MIHRRHMPSDGGTSASLAHPPPLRMRRPQVLRGKATHTHYLQQGGVSMASARQTENKNYSFDKFLTMVERVGTCWFTPEDPGRWLHPLRYRLDHVLLLHLEGRQVDWQGE